MPYKDLHDEPFDETTIFKLEIFEDYAEAWIPVFVMCKEPIICIFDFFAGTGYDKNRIPGSPIRLLEKINQQIEIIKKKGTQVKIYLNEWQPDKEEQNKFNDLKASCEEYLQSHPDLKNLIEVKYHNEDSEKLFFQLLPIIRKYPSLVYLDQNGVKFLSDKYLLELEKTTKTDFIYFVSSSSFWRFGDTDEFREHLQIDLETAKKDPYKFIHRNVLNALKKRITAESPLKLYPFSLKKGANIYGIIFGASHPLAVDKFLAIAWKRNRVNGQANFDIDDDAKKIQVDLFEGKKLTKIELFQKILKERVLSGELKNNFDVLNYAYDEGHIPKHASDHLRSLKSEKMIDFEGTYPLVTYENVYRHAKIVNFKIS